MKSIGFVTGHSPQLELTHDWDVYRTMDRWLGSPAADTRREEDARHEQQQAELDEMEDRR